MNKKKTKLERGITLIALIITIVILLILAVVAINAVKDDGIIGYAKRAKTKQEIAKLEEEVQLALQEYKIQKATGTLRTSTLYTFLKEKLTDCTIEVTSVYGPEYTVRRNEAEYSFVYEGEENNFTKARNGLKVGDEVSTNMPRRTYEVSGSVSGTESAQTVTSVNDQNTYFWKVINIDENTGRVDLILNQRIKINRTRKYGFLFKRSIRI